MKHHCGSSFGCSLKNMGTHQKTTNQTRPRPRTQDMHHHGRRPCSTSCLLPLHVTLSRNLLRNPANPAYLPPTWSAGVRQHQGWLSLPTTPNGRYRSFLGSGTGMSVLPTPRKKHRRRLPLQHNQIGTKICCPPPPEDKAPTKPSPVGRRLESKKHEATLFILPRGGHCRYPFHRRQQQPRSRCSGPDTAGCRRGPRPYTGTPRCRAAGSSVWTQEWARASSALPTPWLPPWCRSTPASRSTRGDRRRRLSLTTARARRRSEGKVTQVLRGQ